jgi:hypothetical protein
VVLPAWRAQNLLERFSPQLCDHQVWNFFMVSVVKGGNASRGAT